MLINWIYLISTLGIAALGFNILINRKGGLYVWEQPFKYTISYYTGKVALTIGLILSVFGVIFALDAINSILAGKVNELPFYLFCGGAIFLLGAINIFARRYI